MDDAFRWFFSFYRADEEVRTRLKQVLLVNWRVVLELAVVRNAFIKNGFSEVVSKIGHLFYDFKKGCERPPSFGFHNIVIIVPKVIYSRVMILYDKIYTSRLTTI